VKIDIFTTDVNRLEGVRREKKRMSRRQKGKERRRRLPQYDGGGTSGCGQGTIYANNVFEEERKGGEPFLGSADGGSDFV